MVSICRDLIRKVVTSCLLTNRLYLKYRKYASGLDDKTLRGKIQQFGHAIDHLYLASNKPVPTSLVWELDFLLDQILKLNVGIDEALLWALSVNGAARKGLHSQYYSGLKQANQKQSGQDTDCGLLDTILKRRSVRHWTSEHIRLGEIEKIISYARWAPSSCNRQLWKVLLVNTESDKQFLTGYFNNTFWLKAPALAVILMDSTIYSPGGEKHYAYLDGAAFIQNMLLLATAFGYGACWIGFAKWDTLGNLYCTPESHQEFYRRFNLKSTLVPVSMIAMGKPDIVPRVIPRQELDTILIREFYR